MRYIDVLSDLVYSYNHSVHRSIKTKPILVNVGNEDIIWHTLHNDVNTDVLHSVKYKFKVGDKVRIRKLKRKFEKGYLPNFSNS